MCDLCDSNVDVRNSAKQTEKHHANLCRKMANLYDGLSSGKIAPHGKEILEYKAAARLLLKDLVNWV